ncbi:MAG TPA: TadE family protein [Acidimicrobiia bacterium]|nr:TadE family protein [Acidimicrobiia bacterium]
MVDTDRRERGATIVEFLGVALLTVVALLGVAQIAMWTWARNVAVNAAHEGARTAAEPGRPLDDGAVRTRQLLHDGLGGAAAAFAVQAAQTGDEVEVDALGDAPSILPFLPSFTITATAHVLDEDAVLR